MIVNCDDSEDDASGDDGDDDDYVVWVIRSLGFYHLSISTRRVYS